jgi:V8-like Glu-specific endopeptidase
LLLAAGCQKDPQLGSEIKRIAAEAELVPVVTSPIFNIPQKYRPLIDAFGFISFGCTATHIGKGIALTAGHCFNAGETPREGSCDQEIKWGLRKDAEPYLVSKCVKVLSMAKNSNVDYAIFMVDPVPQFAIKPNLTKRAGVGTVVTVFGYPKTRPLEWSHTCEVREKKESGGLFISTYFTKGIFHKCDTEPGNSGSTLIDDKTLEVIGIHGGGKPQSAMREGTWNYGTHLLDTPLAEILKNIP